jgi:CDP-diacylglycerol--serine O-phosphatidyltransferase
MVILSLSASNGNICITMNRESKQESSPRFAMLGFALDIPNLMTLAGLCCGLLAIYFASLQSYPAAMIALLWAAFFDWFDGPVAKFMKSRNRDFMAFGAQLDSLADMVSSGVAPAFILLTVGSYHPVFLPGALFLICAGAIRLAYFNIYGLKEDGTYSGVPIGINIILMPLIFLLHGIAGPEQFQWIVYGTILVGGTLNVAPIRFVKLTGAWYIAVACFVLVLTTIYLSQII